MPPRRQNGSVVHTAEWIAQECPRCHSDEAFRTIRADATALTCRACGYDWTMKRMPLDAEAAIILRRKGARQGGVP